MSTDMLAIRFKSAFEFNTDKALHKYLLDHPGADKSKHRVKNDAPAKKSPEKEEGKGKEPPSEEGVTLKVEPAKVEEFKGEIPEYKIKILAGDGGEVTEADLKRARAVFHQLKRGITESADICKISPPVCQQNMGIERRHMPQIPEDSVKSLLASDKPADKKKGEAAVNAGADPKDDRPMTDIFVDWLKKSGVEVKTGEKVEVGKLKATQQEIKAGKTFGMANAYYEGKYDPTKKPIIVSSDNHILDGHHRWSAMLTADPEAKMNVLRIDMPMKDILEKSFEMPGVFRADLQDNIVDQEEPLDLARKPGSTWQQKGKWYAKNSEGKASGPFKSKKAAEGYASGKKSEDNVGKKAATGIEMLTRDVLASVLGDSMALTAMEFDTQEALQKYLHEHPGADKSNHHVKKPSGEGKAPEPSAKSPDHKTFVELAAKANKMPGGSDSRLLMESLAQFHYSKSMHGRDEEAAIAHGVGELTQNGFDQADAHAFLKGYAKDPEGFLKDFDNKAKGLSRDGRKTAQVAYEPGEVEDDDPTKGKGEGSQVPDGEGNKAKRAAAGVELWAAVIADGSLYGATEDSSGAHPQYWGPSLAAEDEAEIHHLVGVPEVIATKLVDHGTSAQKYSDGYVAWDVAQRYSRGPARKLASTDLQAKEAAGGLYGFPKAVQADCEACSRKLGKRASALAKTAWQKEARVADFLQTHAKRAKSVPARVLVAALAEMAPKVEPLEDEPVEEGAEKTASYGMYGFPDKVSSLGLATVASLHEEAGRIAADLHARRADRHDKISGYLAAHCKSARCMYSRLLLDAYPDADTKLASFVPKTAAEWLQWEG